MEVRGAGGGTKEGRDMAWKEGSSVHLEGIPIAITTH